ncbi:MAG: hypothetical protein IPM29_26975 [Planctomycetes bacterium]|nr:hypothetical protein [Planctomycetota bacterium]
MSSPNILRIAMLAAAMGTALLAPPAAAQLDADVRDALAWLDGLGMPDLSDRPFVRATTGGRDRQRQVVYGFLADDRGPSFTLWVSVPFRWPGRPTPHRASAHPLGRWVGVRTPRGTPTDRRVGYELVDLEQFALARLRDARADLDGDGAPTPRTLATRAMLGSDLCLLGWACLGQGHARVARDLLELGREAFALRWFRGRTPDHLRTCLEVDLGETATWELLEDFADPAVPWTELRRRAAAIPVLYPASQQVERALEIAATLQRMIDAPPAEPATAELPPAEQARRLVATLPEQNGVQPSQEVSPDIWADPRGAASPAQRLRALGIDAVPALIDALDDERLTRTVGFHRNHHLSHYVLRVEDVASRVLSDIAGRGFAGRDDALAWLADVRRRGELTVLAEAAARGDDLGVLQAERLLQRGPDRALDALTAGLERATTDDPIRARYVELLAALPAAQPALLRLASDPAAGPASRFAAACATLATAPDRALATLLALWRGELEDPALLSELGEALALCGSSDALDALAARRDRLDVHAMLAFERGQPRRWSLIARLPQAVAWPSPEAAASWSDAVRRLLHDLLLDERVLRASWDDTVEPTLGDFAARALVARWPQPVRFDFDAAPVERRRARVALAAVGAAAGVPPRGG